MATEPQRIVDNSMLVGLVSAVMAQVQAWFTVSWIVTTSMAITNALDSATDTSVLADGVRVLTRWTRNSYLFRWLTKEPNPDVIVIDLRETYTVGPFIAFLDWLAPVFGRMWHGSRIHRLVERVRTFSKRLWPEESRMLRVLAAAFEPPEPPERSELSEPSEPPEAAESPKQPEPSDNDGSN